MLARTHVVFGAFCWGALSLFAGHAIDPVGMGLAMFGSLLPDIDHPKSTFGAKVPFISIPLSRLFGHRGLTHSVIAVVLCLLLLATYAAQYGQIASPLVVGYISHLMGDSVTHAGIPLLWPSKTRFGVELWRTGSVIEEVVLFGLSLGLLLMLTRHYWHR